MGELFANSRIINVPMDRVQLDESEASRFLLYPGDLLFARQSLVLEGAGKCSIFVSDAEQVTFESHVTRVRLDPRLADPHFYFYFLQSYAGKVAIRSIVEQGAGAAGIRGSDLAGLSVAWCKLDHQRATANVLTALDDKIELNRRMGQTLEAIAQAIFKSWFVDFEPVRAKANGEDAADIQARLGLDEATQSLFPSQLAAHGPDGWQPVTLKQLTTKIGSGATPRGGREVYIEEGIALIRSQNVYDSQFVWDGLARITDEAAHQLANVEVQAGDVLLNITGASILRTCVVPPDVLPARVNQHVAIVRARLGVPPHFLHLHLLQAETKAYLLGLNAGASREAVTKAHIESVPLLDPGLGLLAAFNRTVAPLFAQAQACAAEARTLSALRDALLPRLLSGELVPA